MVSTLFYRMRSGCYVASLGQQEKPEGLRRSWVRGLCRNSVHLIADIPLIKLDHVRRTVPLRKLEVDSPLSLVWGAGDGCLLAGGTKGPHRVDATHICSRCKLLDTPMHCWTGYALVSMGLQADTRTSTFQTWTAWDDRVIRQHGGVAQAVAAVLCGPSELCKRGLHALSCLFDNWRFLRSACGPDPSYLLYSVPDLCYFFPLATFWTLPIGTYGRPSGTFMVLYLRCGVTLVALLVRVRLP